MRLEIISDEKTISLDQVWSVLLTSYLGVAEILPSHADSVFLIKRGDIVYNGSERIYTNGGVAWVRDDTVTIFERLGYHA